MGASSRKTLRGGHGALLPYPPLTCRLGALMVSSLQFDGQWLQIAQDPDGVSFVSLRQGIVTSTLSPDKAVDGDNLTTPASSSPP